MAKVIENSTNGTVGTIVDMTLTQANKLAKKEARQARAKAKLVRTIVGDLKNLMVQVQVNGLVALTMQVESEQAVWDFVKMQLVSIPGMAQVEIQK